MPDIDQNDNNAEISIDHKAKIAALESLEKAISSVDVSLWPEFIREYRSRIVACFEKHSKGLQNAMSLSLPIPDLKNKILDTTLDGTKDTLYLLLKHVISALAVKNFVGFDYPSSWMQQLEQNWPATEKKQQSESAAVSSNSNHHQSRCAEVDQKQSTALSSAHLKDHPAFSSENWALNRKEREDKAKAMKINSRMAGLGLSSDEQKNLRAIYSQFCFNKDHFKYNNYPLETLVRLLFVFPEIKVVHLREIFWRSQEILDASFEHSFDALRDVRLDPSLIQALLDSPDSRLYKRLSDNILSGSAFSKCCPVELINKSIFIRLMHIRPTLVGSLPVETVLNFLRDPECRQYRLHQSKPDFSLVFGYDDPSIWNNLEVLFEIYQHYDNDILTRIALHYNPLFGHFQIKYNDQIDAKHKESIDLVSVISRGWLDKNSLRFHYDVTRETLECTGQLVHLNEYDTATHPVSYSVSLLSEITSDEGMSSLISALVDVLEPKAFCQLIESIPQEKRALYLFSVSTSPRRYGAHPCAYDIYIDKLNHNNWFDSATENRFDRDARIDRRKTNLDALSVLIYPAKSLDRKELNAAKQAACKSLYGYCSFWKLSLFGHHHEERARQVIRAINKAGSLAQIGLIIDNQLALLERKIDDPLFRSQNRRFTLGAILGDHVGQNTKSRWFDSNPRNMPDSKKLTSSGYYRALQAARQVVMVYNSDKKEMNMSNIVTNPR